jgi:hypothetical protein
VIRLAESFCCVRCFRYRGLKEFIRANGTPDGECHYCGATHVHVIEIGELSDKFHNWLGLFVADDASLDTVDWYIQEWEVFNDNRLDEEARGALLDDIINASWDDDDGEPQIHPTDYYRRRRDIWDEWEEFCDEVRNDPATPLPFNEFMQEEFGRRLITLAAGASLYRARPGHTIDPADGSAQPYRGADIGAPPVCTTSGRAHQAPTRVLYGADQEATAVAEIRPARGMGVSVCQMTANRDLRIVDLTLPGTRYDPFFTDEAHYHMSIEGLLIGLGEEMAKPLSRNDDETHYRPSQVLAEFIRDSGYDGIRYPSAMRPKGTSVVLFDPDVMTIGPSRLVRVKTVSVIFTDYDD